MYSNLVVIKVHDETLEGAVAKFESELDSNLFPNDKVHVLKYWYVPTALDGVGIEAHILLLRES